VYGLEHPTVARDVNNIGQILKDQGDLVGALSYSQRALVLYQRFYGPDHPSTKKAAAHVEEITQRIQGKR